MAKQKKNPRPLENAIIPEPLPEIAVENISNNTLSFLEENVVYDIPQNQPEAPKSHPYATQILAWQRDQFGFISNIPYKFKEDGLIDWAAMIPKRFFVPNKEKFPEGTDFSSLKVEDLREDQLLLLLAGVRYVGKLAGIKSVRKAFPTSTPEYVSCICTVEFYPDSNGISFVYDGEGDAHYGNTHSFARDFLTTIAGNRAEARAIKTGLNISFLTQEEMGPSEKEKKSEKSAANTNITGPIATLKNLLDKEKVSFAGFKTLMIKRQFVDDSFSDINEFPKEHVIEAIGIVKERLKAIKGA